jgi:hypothetical protein
MHDDRWWGWLGLIILFVIFQGLRALFRGAKNAQGGMARMNAAAERILKERGASVANPLPRTTRGQIAAAKPRHNPAVMKAGATPAVVRRGSLLSGGREPVVQRRR